MALLSMVVAGTLGLFTLALHRTHDGRTLTEASALARSVMERVNRPAAHEWFDAGTTSTSIEKPWTRKDLSGSLEVSAAEGSGEHHSFRNELRQMFLDVALPYGPGEEKRNELSVLIEAVPDGSTFADASMLRIQVRVLWTERGLRSRSVQLETLQVKDER